MRPRGGGGGEVSRSGVPGVEEGVEMNEPQRLKLER